MSRYIDADALLNSLPENLPYKASVKRVLIQAPSADVVAVVRCRDCKFWDREHIGCPDDDTLSDYAECFKLSDSIECIYVKCDDYCSHGERKEQNEG